MENTINKLYEKYGVNDFQGLIKYFEMKTLTPLEDLEINDSVIYHSAGVILKNVMEDNFNPLREKIMLFTSFLDSFYKINFEETSKIIEVLGTFKTYFLFNEVLKDNIYYQEFYNLYIIHIERFNNIGIIVMEQGKDLFARVQEFLKDLSPEFLNELLEGFLSQVKELGIAEDITKNN